MEDSVSSSLPQDQTESGDQQSAFPLMPMQRGMMFAALEQPSGIGAYVEQVVGVLKEELDFIFLEEAWKRVLLRHDALRTRFDWRDLSDAVQYVDSKLVVNLEFEDWWEDGAENVETKWNQFLEADRAKGIRLSERPLYRTTVIRISETEYRMVWTVFHGLVDGRSLALVIREVFSCYDALVIKSNW